MSQIPLRLKPAPDKHPIVGYCAVGCGLAGIFVNGVVFVPIGFIFSLIALVMGQGAWGVMGLLLTILGFVTTPAFLLFLGWRAMVLFLDRYFDGIYEGPPPVEPVLPEV